MNSNHKKSGYPLEESCHQPLHLQRYTKLLPLLQQQHSPPSHNGNTTIPNLSLTTSVTTTTSNLTEDDLSYLSYRIQYLMEVDRLAYSSLLNPTPLGIIWEIISGPPSAYCQASSFFIPRLQS
jgi:hypothetical protein